jgi:tRNA(His) 5'-end guanylyltransferase
MMNKTAQYLCQMVQGTHLAYVQSDEITLIIKKNTEDSEVFFGGRLGKMQSIIASLATAKFNQLMIFYNMEYHPNINPLNTIENTALCQFDCKIWDIDNANDAMAWLLFRNIDCTRNSKQQTCQTYLPHKELMSKHTDEQVALLLEKKGINWFDLPDGQKYGRLIQKQMVTEERTFSTKDGIERTESCVRSKWQIIDGFDLTVSANRERITEMYPIFKDEGTI